MCKQIHQLSAGFSLLEMLIALLILSIGLLGVATLQTRGQQFNQVGYLRTQATFLAYDIMDRIRINPSTNYALSFDSAGGKNYHPACDGDENKNCAPNQLRDYDLNNWLKLLKDALPQGDAEIIRNSNVRYTITIRWMNIIDRSDKAEHEDQQWVLQL